MRLRSLIAVATLAVGCAPGTTETGDASDPATQPGSGNTVPVGPQRSNSHESDGPLEAALAYVASTDTLMAHSSIGRAEIFRSMVAPEAVAEQAAAFEQAAEQLALTLDLPVERLVWVEAPLTATVLDHSDSDAAVAVWTVSILGARGAGSPQQVWRTVRVDLERLDDRWLVASATADVGPTPAANELALQSGWDEFARVAGWDPIVAGVGL
jgi:hypothetical protein